MAGAYEALTFQLGQHTQSQFRCVIPRLDGARKSVLPWMQIAVTVDLANKTGENGPFRIGQLVGPGKFLSKSPTKLVIEYPQRFYQSRRVSVIPALTDFFGYSPCSTPDVSSMAKSLVNHGQTSLPCQDHKTAAHFPLSNRIEVWFAHSCKQHHNGINRLSFNHEDLSR